MSTSKLNIMATLPLHNSQHQIPRLGFGVYQSPPPTCVHSCLTAFRSSYRHIDTAQYYSNESSVGRAIRESNIPRAELFITTKILCPGEDVDATYKVIKESVERLDGKKGYVDLFLIHSPNGGEESRKLMWEALERAKKEGQVRDIGVSNYGIQHIEEMKPFAKTWPPVVNQIELHPWCQQREAVEYCQKNNIVVEAYCPLVRNQKAHDKTLQGVAEKHKKTPSQVLIRWSLQKGYVPLPKSDSADRIQANAQVFDFDLDEEDMKALDALDQGKNGAVVQAVSN